MDLNDYEKNKYRRMCEKSRNGGIATRNKNKKTKIGLKEYLNRNKALIGTCVLVTSIVLSGSSTLMKIGKEKVQKDAVITEISNEFYQNLLEDEIHRTPADRSKYYIDYNDIAENIENYGDIDEAVFFLELHFNDKELDDILDCTKYGSFEGFKEARGYDSTKEFRQEMEKRIVLSDEINKKEIELQMMQDEHREATQEDEMSLGGK